MSGSAWYTFQPDTGDRTKITRASEVNANFDWSEGHLCPHIAGVKTGATYDLGSDGSTLYPYKRLILDNTATDGGAIYFNGVDTSFLKSSSDGLTLSTGGFTGLTLGSNLTVTGTWTNLGTVTTVDINGGSIDGASIGSNSTSTGAFTSLICPTINSMTIKSTNTSVCLGVGALTDTTTGSNNSVFGYNSLTHNVEGHDNTAVGYLTLHTSAEGYNNTAIGGSCASVMTTGHDNVSVGNNSTYKLTEGYNNTAIGINSLHECLTGHDNTAVGDASLYDTTSYNNTAIGKDAGNNVTSGHDNVFVGISSGTDAVANITTQSDYGVFGNNNLANANIKVAWTVTSDARDKTNFSSVPYGLDFVCDLKPTAFQFKTSRENPAPKGNIRYGFLAQDVLQLEGSNPVIINNEDEDNLKYNESSLIPVLVNAIKELKLEIDKLKNETN